MKKSILCFLLFLASCKTETAIFKRNDTVYNFRNRIVFVIDSQVYRNRNRNQVFYECQYLNGAGTTWLPQNSIRRARKGDVKP